MLGDLIGMLAGTNPEIAMLMRLMEQRDAKELLAIVSQDMKNAEQTVKDNPGLIDTVSAIELTVSIKHSKQFGRLMTVKTTKSTSSTPKTFYIKLSE